MSRYTITVTKTATRRADPDAVIGYDRPLQTFFLQAFPDEEGDDLALWLGTQYRAHETLSDLRASAIANGYDLSRCPPVRSGSCSTTTHERHFGPSGKPFSRICRRVISRLDDAATRETRDLGPGPATEPRGLLRGFARRIQSSADSLFTRPRYVSDKGGLPTRKRVSNPFAGFGVPHGSGAVCSVREKSATRRSRPQGRAAPPIFTALRCTPLRKIGSSARRLCRSRSASLDPFISS